MRISSDFFAFWAGVTNITLVLRFMKSDKLYYVQTAKVVYSKMLVVKESNFVHVTVYLSGYTGRICLKSNVYFQHIKKLLQIQKVTHI